MGLVAREWFGRPDEAMTLVGITGTKGKTTVVYLVESIVACRRAIAQAGSGPSATRFGGHETEAARTTPEATDLYELLASMRDAGTEIVAMEVSSHALALHRVAGARFPVAAFLNLGRDHLEFHGGSDAYFEAEGLCSSTVSARRTPRSCRRTIRADACSPAARARRARSFSGTAPNADVRIEDERSGLDGSVARLTTPRGRIDVRTAASGRLQRAERGRGCRVRHRARLRRAGHRRGHRGARARAGPARAGLRPASRSPCSSTTPTRKNRSPPSSTRCAS